MTNLFKPNVYDTVYSSTLQRVTRDGTDQTVRYNVETVPTLASVTELTVHV